MLQRLGSAGEGSVTLITAAKENAGSIRQEHEFCPQSATDHSLGTWHSSGELAWDPPSDSLGVRAAQQYTCLNPSVRS